MRLTDRDLNRATLARQMLLARTRAPVVGAVERLLALQAQVPRPPFVALWARLEGFDRADLHRALHDRVLVRATMMRGTLHLMSANDFVAFRGALQPSLTAGAATITGKAPLPPLERLLEAARSAFGRTGCTFNDARAALREVFPKHHDRLMAYAVRLHLPLVQVPTIDDAWSFPADSAFLPAEKWLKRKVRARSEASTLVLRYLAAFGPASSADIQSWTGLRGVAEVLKPLRPRLVTFEDARGRELFDVPKGARPGADADAPVRFLPEYDSVVIAHADRSRLIDEKFRKALVTRNLIVPATFLVDGRIAGTWKIARKGRAATLTLSPFVPLAKRVRAALEEEGDALLRFVEPDATTLSVN